MRHNRPSGGMRFAGSALIFGLMLVATVAAQKRANPQAVALQHFQERVKAYVDLRNGVKAKMTPLKETDDPATISSRQKALGEAIRTARSDARQGDVFIPEVVPIFKKLIREDFSRRTSKQKAAAATEVPAHLDLHVNDFYPTTLPLATVPPKLLANLPVLPDGLEYRFVADRLILRDINPNLVVDFIDKAVPWPSKPGGKSK